VPVANASNNTQLASPVSAPLHMYVQDLAPVDGHNDQIQVVTNCGAFPASRKLVENSDVYVGDFAELSLDNTGHVTALSSWRHASMQSDCARSATVYYYGSKPEAGN
jgi:hypothetical protein